MIQIDCYLSPECGSEEALRANIGLATTRAGMVSAPLRSRFGMTARLDYYNAEQMQKIIVRSANLLGVEIDPAGAAEIAARSRGTPRTANNLLRWVRDYVQVKAEGKITAELADRALAMLEIDRDTGEPKLLRLVAVDDAGHLINPLIVEGQIHGGLAQGIGQAMIEEVVYNSDGQLITGSFMDYALPRAIDFPRFELDSTVTPTPVNPLGAKGVGEAGTLGSTPSVVSAAVDALSEFGVKHVDMMLRPERLWRIIHGQAPRTGLGARSVT